MAQRRRARPKKPKARLPVRFVLLILTALCIVSMLLGLTMNLSGGPLSTVAGVVLVPMQRGVNLAGRVISDRLGDLQTLTAVQEENAALKAQVNDLTEQLNKIQLEQYDLENYRTLLELDEKYPDYEKAAAHVIGKDTGNWFSTFLIDKGERDGISVDMNVIADEGLVGIVTSVGANYAKVRSIIDDLSQVSGQVMSTADNCVVKGDLVLMDSDRVLSLEKLKDDDDEVVVGDAVVTSSVSSKFMPGLLIGYITELDYDSNQLTKSGRVSPVVDFEHLSEVLVILEIKESSGLEG